MRVAVVGGGAGGLFATLVLARAGHDVVLLEQEQLHLGAGVDDAAARAFRPSAPQIVQPHIVMARCRTLLREHLPDVYDALLAAGVAEAPLAVHMPPTLADTAPRPGDERLTTLMTRRSTFDWVLARAVADQARVTLRGGVRVLGLDARPGAPPHVTGVRTNVGDIAADLVVDAAGRRSPIDRWLAAIGASPPASRWAECGLAYYSRHYRAPAGADLPGPLTSRTLMAFDEFLAGIWGADNGTMQVAIAPLAADHRFRTSRDPAVFDAVMRTIPVFAAWLDALEPITPVFHMAGIHNTLRRLVVDGCPVVTGLHPIGDSVCTTNPTLGRGLSLALTGAVDLLELISTHGDDWTAQALALDECVHEHIQPFYEDQAVIDSSRLARLRQAVLGDAPPPPTPPHPDRVTYADLAMAGRYDPTAFRALWRIHGMTDKPIDVYTDPDVVTATRTTLEQNRECLATPQPDPPGVLAALRGVPADAGS